jgi:hypothetical protein
MDIQSDHLAFALADRYRLEEASPTGEIYLFAAPFLPGIIAGWVCLADFGGSDSCALRRRQRLAEPGEHLHVAVNVPFAVLHRQGPLLLVARGHEDPPVEQPGERGGE